MAQKTQNRPLSFDVEKETACILVYTSYYFDGTDAMGVDLYIYDLIV